MNGGRSIRFHRVAPEKMEAGAGGVWGVTE